MSPPPPTRAAPNQLKHQMISQHVGELLRKLPPGYRLPTEQALAQSFGCHFLTVRRAMRTLVDEGLITRRAGSGTFVADYPKAATDGKMCVGMLVHQGVDEYAIRLLKAVAEAADTMGVELRSCWISSFTERNLAQAQALTQEGCTALTLPWFPISLKDEVASFVAKCPLPVSLPVALPGLQQNYFGKPENFGKNLLQSTDALCRYFTHLGRRQLAFVGPLEPRNPLLQLHLSAYTAFTSEHWLPCLPILLPAGCEPMDRAARELERYRGSLWIICYDDQHALRLMRALRQVGMHAPEDYGIIGHNNIDAARLSDPTLSTIDQDFPLIGGFLLKSAIALSEGSTFTANNEYQKPLLVRGSCGGRGSIDDAFRELFPSLNLVEATGSQ